MSAIKELVDVSQDDFTRSRMLEDLHLAAELGKTLLDRNRELETLLKERQTTIEDQKLEIEYLTKQTVALKEVNDARLRIYEQLEVSIQDLERTNHRLQLENSTEKKNNKSLNASVEQLEAKNQDLQATIDEIRDSSAKEISKYERLTSALESQLENLCQQNQALENQLSQQEGESRKKSVHDLDEVRSQIDALKRDSDVIGVSKSQKDASKKRGEDASSSQKSDENSSSPGSSRLPNLSSVETQPECDQNSTDEVDSRSQEIDQIMEELRSYQRLNAELEEQLSTKNQQYEDLEKQLNQQQGSNMMMSMHEELNTLDEVRQGQMCSKCLRNVDQSSDFPEDDDQSMLNDLLTATPQHRSSFSMNVQDHLGNQSSPLPSRANANPYKVLVEKYEALVEVHRGQPLKSTSSKSFQEEMHMSGEFAPPSTKDTDEESGHGGSHTTTAKQHKQTRKTFSTPTDFSEAETSSSGFADETSNKGTQTDGRVGSFLCTIADGEDCKFSIYDDASPFDSRFRDRPEYRDLFKEIFRVLKKAAENKAEGEELPLLDDTGKTVPKVPQVTPMNEQLPELFPDDDDTQSVMSSTMSELSTQNETTTVVESIVQSQNQPIPEASSVAPNKPECILRPLVRQPLEYVSIESSRKRSSSRKKNKFTERSDSPMTHIIGSPKITYSSRPSSGRRRRDNNKPNAAGDENSWNGNTLQFWATSRANVASPTPSQGSGKGYFEYKPSPASQDLNKLKNLEKTYADVLRCDVKKQEMRRHRRTK